jgi:hypothetical protein
VERPDTVLLYYRKCRLKHHQTSFNQASLSRREYRNWNEEFYIIFVKYFKLIFILNGPFLEQKMTIFDFFFTNVCIEKDGKFLFMNGKKFDWVQDIFFIEYIWRLHYLQDIRAFANTLIVLLWPSGFQLFQLFPAPLWSLWWDSQHFLVENTN